ncbi:MAG: hypothetical protein LN568_01475 [Rickettsia endosymbiont of Pseudomimeciton antennatum]|nr:hypothetical protein [Rickettsia endosymbiont of Pseudomimeciton antennatum]MCC8397783.1 hypothetical protein [Rickettsia endosymbiont of Labidopullus appendiculatus]
MTATKLCHNNNDNDSGDAPYTCTKLLQEIKGKLLALSGRIVVFTHETFHTNKRVESSLRALTKQLYDMQQNVDFIRSYIEVGRERDDEDDS